MSITQEVFGTVDEVPRERGGLTARIMTYGGTVVSLQAPDRPGRPATFNPAGERRPVSGTPMDLTALRW